MWKGYLKLTSIQQQEYFKTMLTQFNDYMQEQRNEDLTRIQNNLVEENECMRTLRTRVARFFCEMRINQIIDETARLAALREFKTAKNISKMKYPTEEYQ